MWLAKQMRAADENMIPTNSGLTEAMYVYLYNSTESQAWKLCVHACMHITLCSYICLVDHLAI